jgi:hypothetical protein
MAPSKINRRAVSAFALAAFVSRPQSAYQIGAFVSGLLLHCIEPVKRNHIRFGRAVAMERSRGEAKLHTTCDGLPELALKRVLNLNPFGFGHIDHFRSCNAR